MRRSSILDPKPADSSRSDIQHPASASVAIVAHCSCGAKYRLPDSAAGRRARCKRCGGAFDVPALEGGDEEVIPFTNLDALAEGQALERAKPPPATSGGAAVPGAGALAAQSGGRLRDERGAGSERAGRSRSRRPRTFWTALPRLLLFPAKTREVAVFVGVSLALAVEYFGVDMLLATGRLRMALLALLVMLTVEGAFAAFSLGIIQQEAAGEEDLPEFPLTSPTDLSEWWGAFIVPLWTYALICLAAAGPALSYLWAAPDAGLDAIFFALLALGLFLWPMIALLVTLRGFGALGQIALAVVAIVRTLPAYVCVVLLVYGSAALWIFSIAALESDDAGSLLAVNAAAATLRVYTQVLAMRAIGRYYKYHESGFAWLTNE